MDISPGLINTSKNNATKVRTMDQATPLELTMIQIDKIAQLCHGITREYQAFLGESANQDWVSLSNEDRDSVRDGVRNCLKRPMTHPQVLHEQWMEFYLRRGWSWGEIKDTKAKLHPNLLPFSSLKTDQQLKDSLFGAVIMLVSPLFADIQAG